MHHEAERWTKRLRKELGDQRLVVRWNQEIQRFQVGEKVRSGAADSVHWFYTVTDGKSGFRGMGWHVIRKVASLDKAQSPSWMKSAEAYEAALRDEQTRNELKEAEERQYRLKHEVKYLRRYWDPFNTDPNKRGVEA